MFRLGVVFMVFNIDGQFVYNIFVLRKRIFYLPGVYNNKYFCINNLIITQILCAIRNTDSSTENIPVGHINFQSLAVSLRTTRFNIQKFYTVLALR
jgi:hypothetical protein